jgi:hypothetical protein
MRRRLSSDGMWTIATPIGGRSGLGKNQAEQRARFCGELCGGLTTRPKLVPDFVGNP